MKLPSPNEEQAARSRELAGRIRAEIESAGGWLRFDRYMQLALYAPELGYYTGPEAKFGAHGDFVTAPALGDFLARALAEQLAPALAALARPRVLELGAGDGRLARQLIRALGERGCEPLRYRILETSGSLRARQQAELAGAPADVAWLDTLPAEPFEGVILANEVIDALPVVPFVKRGARALPLGVRVEGNAFAWAVGPEDAMLTAAVAALECDLGTGLPEAYRSEISLLLGGWTAALSAALARGHALFIDYGLVRREYYHRSRNGGTLICHYRHRAHEDPFAYPGLTDISAWVDFSAVAAAAAAAGFAVGGFTTQGQFLLAAAAQAAARPEAHSARELAALKTLILPGEMGERFKVISLSKGRPPMGLAGRDFRARL